MKVSTQLQLLDNIYPRIRLIFAIGCGALVSAILPSWMRLPTRILCIWNAGAYSFLALTWWKMIRARFS